MLDSGGFDLVFTGIDAICWLHGIRRWAAVVAELLAPGGRLFLREGHPVLWALDDERDDDLLVPGFPYFEHDQPYIWEGGGTYVETPLRTIRVEFTTPGVNWSHGLGEIVTALLKEGLIITELIEQDSVPWEALPGKMTRITKRRVAGQRTSRAAPHTYTLQARKPS